MTAFSTSQLPTGTRAITTVEELHAWSGAILATINPTKRFIRKLGESSEMCHMYGDFPDSEGIYRDQYVSIFDMDPAKAGLSLPSWKLLKESSTTAIPTNFTG